LAAARYRLIDDVKEQNGYKLPEWADRWQEKNLPGSPHDPSPFAATIRGVPAARSAYALPEIIRREEICFVARPRFRSNLTSRHLNTPNDKPPRGETPSMHRRRAQPLLPSRQPA
jgi:hypothetical protein